MIKLLMRFYDVNSGSIKVDGHDVRDFNRSELQRNVRNGASGYLAVSRNHHGKYPLWTGWTLQMRKSSQAAKAAHVHRFIQTAAGRL